MATAVILGKRERKGKRGRGEERNGQHRIELRTAVTEMALPALSRMGGSEGAADRRRRHLPPFVLPIHTPHQHLSVGELPRRCPTFKLAPNQVNCFPKSSIRFSTSFQPLCEHCLALISALRFSQTCLRQKAWAGGNPARDTWSVVPGKNARKQEEEEPLYAQLWNCVGSPFK